MEASLLLETYTDQGRQCRAPAYRELLEANSITFSMHAKSSCWDNPVMGNLFSTLKQELALDDYAEARISPQWLQRDLVFWIDDYYNRERLKSTLS